MSENSNKDQNDVLLPGDRANCPDCGARHRALILVDGHLSCPVCLSPFGGAYDTLDSSRPRSEYDNDAGEQSSQGTGHGPAHRPGSGISGTVISGGRDHSGAPVGKAWRGKGRFAAIQNARDQAEAEGSPSRRASKALIRSSLGQYPTLQRIALWHFEVGWPYPAEKNSSPKTVWSAAHPWGVYGAAAAAIYTAHEELNIDPDRKALVAMFPSGGRNPCPKPLKVLRKSVKAMHSRLGQPALKQALHRRNNVRRMLVKAIQSEPRLLDISAQLHDQGELMAADSDNFQDNLRNPVACLTWKLSREFSKEPLIIADIATLFGVSTGFHSWLDDICRHLERNGVDLPDFNSSNRVAKGE